MLFCPPINKIKNQIETPLIYLFFSLFCISVISVPSYICLSQKSISNPLSVVLKSIAKMFQLYLLHIFQVHPILSILNSLTWATSILSSESLQLAPKCPAGFQVWASLHSSVKQIRSEMWIWLCHSLFKILKWFPLPLRYQVLVKKKKKEFKFLSIIFKLSLDMSSYFICLIVSGLLLLCIPPEQFF